jgi:ATP-dependent exoDNAse (exonuclease V) alpha subunit
MTQEQAFEILRSGKNAFITGPAGSGKTYLLNRYIDWLKDAGANVAVTASTGIAATHLDGITLHSWTGMGVRDQLLPRDVKELVKRGYLRRRFSRASVIIIDEISMLAAHQLDMADQLFRAFAQVDAAFGGVQAVLCGDFFQLPPVRRGPSKEDISRQKSKPQASFDFSNAVANDEPRFAYESAAWKSLGPQVCYLDEQHRQSDREFLETLGAIRSDRVQEKTRQCLRERVGAKIQMAIEPTKLYTHNVDVDIENNLELAKINGKEFRYEMESAGPPALVENLQRSCLAPRALRLKEGARVMFVKNNFEEGYVNGTLGVVEKLGEERIMVRTSRGQLMDVGPASWHIAEEGKIKAEITQYPLRLAWAITVHKSQGMSLDAALVDLRQSFEPGMGYVALSRVRSLKGLSLAGFNEMSLRVNEKVLEFDQSLIKESAAAVRQLAKDHLPPRFFVPLAKKEKKPDTVALTKELAAKGLPLVEIAAARKLKPATIIKHCEKIKSKDPEFDFSRLAKHISGAKLAALKTILKKIKNKDNFYPLKPAMELAGDGVSYDELRLARLLIKD